MSIDRQTNCILELVSTLVHCWKSTATLKVMNLIKIGLPATLNLHPLILNWISSYLSLRNQCVVVNGASSDSVQVISGVPQGSVLGPLLFSIYIDSVTSLNLSSNLVLYADDILLYMPIVNDTDCAALQSDIDKILNWTTANLMSFNSSKCKHMIISRTKVSSCCFCFSWWSSIGTS